MDERLNTLLVQANSLLEQDPKIVENPANFRADIMLLHTKIGSLVVNIEEDEMEAETRKKIEGDLLQRKREVEEIMSKKMPKAEVPEQPFKHYITPKGKTADEVGNEELYNYMSNLCNDMFIALRDTRVDTKYLKNLVAQFVRVLTTATPEQLWLMTTQKGSEARTEPTYTARNELLRTLKDGAEHIDDAESLRQFAELAKHVYIYPPIS